MPTRAVVVATDPALRAAAQAALQALGWCASLIVEDEASLLAAVVNDKGGFQRLLLQNASLRLDYPLLDALAEASPQAVISMLPLRADTAMIRDILAKVPPLATLQGSLIVTLRPGGLMLRYQPIVCLKTNRLVMVEALARWASEPVALTPVNFVPAMERMGLGPALAGAVIRMATQDLARLRLRPSIGVSVNLSVAEFSRQDVVSWIGRELRRSRLPRTRLAIELTETSPVVDRGRLRRSLRRLRRAGHDVMIDDFIMDDVRRPLLRLPFSGVKLDRSLVQKLPWSARARHLVRSVSRMGLTVTAEGVSSPHMWRGLRHLGVARVQGFWVARPLPITALPAWTQKWRAVQPRKARP